MNVATLLFVSVTLEVSPPERYWLVHTGRQMTIKGGCKQSRELIEILRQCCHLNLFEVHARAVPRRVRQTRTAATTTRGPKTQPHASVPMALPLQLLLLLLLTRRELVLR